MGTGRYLSDLHSEMDNIPQSPKPKDMKTIKADAYWSHTLEYTVNGKEYSVTGEFDFNKKKQRIEHLHIGPKGGKYLIVY